MGKRRQGDSTYNRAHVWQIGCFSLNNTAVNLYFMMIAYISYFAAGVLGLGVALVSVIIASMNVLDAFTDPIAGWIIDRTNGKLGKFRPFMVLGNVIMILSMALLYATSFLPAGKVVAFVGCYVVYVFGYTLQFCITRAAQTVLTNDPKQRPLFSAFDMVLNIILYVGVSMVVSNYLVPKYGDFTLEMFGEFFIITALSSAVCTALAVAGIWTKDRPQFYGNTSIAQPKLGWRDFFDVVKGNRNVQMLMVSAGSDKLFSNLTTNATVMVIVYGIICGDFALSGQMNMYVFMPSLIISLICVQVARKMGQKRALLLGTWGAIIFNLVIFVAFIVFDPTSLSFETWTPFTLIFLVALALRGGFMSINNSIVVPMIADCADAEVARSGRYMPTMIGAMFSFVDKVVTSLNSLIVGGLVMLAGFTTAYPTVNDACTPALFAIGMIMFCGLPFVGWVLNVICMRFYQLDKQGMEEVHREITGEASAASAA